MHRCLLKIPGTKVWGFLSQQLLVSLCFLGFGGHALLAKPMGQTGASPSQTKAGQTGAYRAATVTVVHKPSISLCMVSPAIVTPTETCELTAEFSSGKGRVTPGNIPVSSGKPLILKPMETTEYTLTVTNDGGASTTAPFTVRVVNAFQGKFSPSGTMSKGGLRQEGMVKNGKVLLSDANQYEWYDPKTGVFMTHGDIPQGGGGLPVFLSNGKLLILGTPEGALYDPIVGTTKIAGAMNEYRSRLHATLLLDGKVLVSGGFRAGAHGKSKWYKSAEIYNPCTGQFLNTSNEMSSGRYSHTAVVLADGKALITGGVLNNGADLYDPKTNKFTPTGHMLQERWGHTATLLPNGKVLVVGGSKVAFNSGKEGNLEDAELYDPSTGTFSFAGKFVKRQLHAATLLANGQVLITGGEVWWTNGKVQIIADAELYDPILNTVVPAGRFQTARRDHSATLLPDGRVLISGGADQTRKLLLSAEIFDSMNPTGEKGSPVISTQPTSQTLHAGQAATFDVAVNGLLPMNFQWFMNGVAIPGAHAASFTVPCVSEAQNGAQFTVRVSNSVGSINSIVASLRVDSPPLPVPVITEFASTKSLVASGTETTLQWNTTGEYRLVLNPGNRIVTGKKFLKLTVNEDTTYTLTATNFDGVSTTATATVRVVLLKADPANIVLGDSSALLPLFPEGRGVITPGVGEVQSGSPIVVTPRWTVQYTLTVTTDAGECLTSKATVNPSGDLHAEHTSLTATLLRNGKVLIVGGASSVPAELYDPSTGKAELTGKTAVNRYYHTATRLPNGKVLIAGGTGRPDFLSSCELYDPATGEFSPTGSMAEGRSDHTATLLHDGRVLILGGWNGKDNFVSAELYDPATGKFSSAGHMLNKQSWHTTTVLADSRVLIVGVDNAELYDPGTGMFNQASSAGKLSWDITATLLPDNSVLILSRYATKGLIYDPTKGTFTPTPGEFSKRSSHTATLLPDGKVFITDNAMPALLYDPPTGSFRPLPHMVAAYPRSATLLRNGKVLVCSDYNKITYLFDPMNPKPGGQSLASE